MTLLHPDRLLPAEPGLRQLAREIYASSRDLPLICPHGHTDPAWFASDAPFANATELLLLPDHYLLRMLYSQGLDLDALGLGAEGDQAKLRAGWRLFAEHYHLFRGTPSAIWLNHVFHEIFGLEGRFGADTADGYYDAIGEQLATPAFRPRALYARFNIEVLCTTDAATDTLDAHRALAESGWSGRVIPCFRPDAVVDPEHTDFLAGLQQLAELSGEDTASYAGYLAALQQRRQVMKSLGATSTDHGHPTAATCDLSRAEAEALYAVCRSGEASPAQAETFRAHMLVEMARMSLEDGLVMQLHPGSLRNHNSRLFARYGRDKGADIPVRCEYTRALAPLLARYGNEPGLTLIVFTLDESTYARELAPLAGHYPALRLGPAWWFHDSPEGMRRFRETTTETAGFYNTAGFNDDTRAFLSIPARHDMARRVDAGFLARLVAEHRLDFDEAQELAHELAYGLAKRSYRL